MENINYANILSQNIIRLRKQTKMTQEQLALELSISFQAVSKWENNQSSPDITLLPLVAKIFNVTIDYLFDIKPKENLVNNNSFSWEDDNIIRVVSFKGHNYIDNCMMLNNNTFVVECKDEVCDVISHFNIECTSVLGDAKACGNINCTTIGSDAKAGGNINCTTVGSDVKAGGNVTCLSVGSDVSAGCEINISGDILGDASAGLNINYK